MILRPNKLEISNYSCFTDLYMTMISKNPATGEILKEFATLTLSEAEVMAQTTKSVQKKWRLLKIEERTPFATNLAKVLRENLDEYAKLMSLEMGKPITQARAEVEKCAVLCEHYAQEAAAYLKPIEIKTAATKSYVRFDPLGVLLCIMPWNYPFWQVIRAAVPTLMAGNGVLLKHASNVPQCALALHDAFSKAGFPEHIFQTLLIDGPTASALISSDAVDCVTLTGSTQAGLRVAAECAKNLKKVVLELGGSDPFIIFEDADLEKACTTALTARMQNAGQSCIAAKRFLVHSSIKPQFEARMTELFKTIVVGDPLDEKTTLGPVATADFANQLKDQLDRSTAKGARLITGGDVNGAFFTPAFVGPVSRDVPVWSEETFGPLLAYSIFTTEDEALEFANATEYGLGAVIWTNDIERANRLIPLIDAGTVTINGLTKSDPRLPFGGTKKSGLGREMGEFGIKEFVNTKTVVFS